MTWVDKCNPALWFSGKGCARHTKSHGPWISPDPVKARSDAIHHPQSSNLYAYCRNSPVTLLDPDGRAIDYQNDPVRLFVEYLATRNRAVRDTLARYDADHEPDLRIEQVEREANADGELAGFFIPGWGDYTMDSPSGSGNWEALRGLTEEEIMAGRAIRDRHRELPHATYQSGRERLQSHQMDASSRRRGQ
ncbi:MAG: hypothetical protein AB1714_07555 [Acidobacteriota bacterium]